MPTSQPFPDSRSYLNPLVCGFLPVSSKYLSDHSYRITFLSDHSQDQLVHLVVQSSSYINMSLWFIHEGHVSLVRVELLREGIPLIDQGFPGGSGGKESACNTGDLGSVPQFCSVAQSCPTLCDPMDCSTPGLPVHHQLPESTQTHVHRVSDAIQTSHPLLSPSPLAPNPSQHQGLFQ